jgi:serine/threonine protein kinase
VTSAIKSIGEKGFSHGDVKPENILLKRDENGHLSVRVADFGMAGIIGGTPLYMAPEVLKKSIPFVSDIYSLGISLLFSVVDIQLAFKLYLIPGLKDLTRAGKVTKKLSILFLLKMAERSETKCAKRSFASKIKIKDIFTRSFASRF